MKSRLHYGLRSLRLLLQEKGVTAPVSAADRYAAYVLGALSPDGRAEFEAHLAGCDRCRTAVGEPAEMLGMLAQVPPAEAWALADQQGRTERTVHAAGRRAATSRGRGSEVKPWTVRPNRVMHPSGVSPLPLDDLSAVEIRKADEGQVLLRANAR